MKKNKNLVLIKKTFTRQYSQFYCGLACLVSIVKYHRGDTSQEKLRENSGTTLKGTSLLGLYQSAQELGFHVKGYEAGTENLKKITVPVILHILKDNNLEHYVVCYGYQNKKFIIGDPSWGITEYREDELDILWKSKTLLYLEPGKNFIHSKTNTAKKQIWFKELIKDDIPVLMIAAFMGMVISVLGLTVAIYTQKLIDNILPTRDNELLFKSLGIFTFILLAKSFISYIRSIILTMQSKEMNIRIISSFFGKLLYLPKNFFDSTSTGDMVGRLNDTQRIQRAVVILSNNIIIDILIIISSLIYILSVSLSSGLLCMLTIPTFGILALRYNKKVIDHQRLAMQTYAITESKFIDTIQGIKIIKSGNKESLLAKSVNEIYKIFQEKVYNLGILGNKINFWAQIGSVAFIAGIIAWTSFLVLKEQMLLGQMMAIITITGSLVTSVINTSLANIQFQEAKVAFERMFEFSSIKPEYTNNKIDESQSLSINTIEFKNLNFRFPGKKLLFKNLNSIFRKGEISTIFGEVGCGKSTLISLLLRFYYPESGKIFINNKEWSEINTPLLRKGIGVVSQHVKLFSGTLIENIALQEKPDASDVIKFCTKIGIDVFINEFQQGYATIIRENNTNLSGGQQQLLALARALYQKPQVLLLDEATAAMDIKTEHFVLNLLNQLKQNMIIILVTHRIQIASKADKIFMIKDHQIIPYTSISELVNQNELYKNLLINPFEK